ncbi:uncharacterized protein LOC127002101 isoform X3 [Eriocheir sinensis]|uniref:uncharacterized protein LOC127002101 isoform X3 n=1 Tax=Eriocheir sinensis TaxID=95602 RepID=UPI0021C800B4|nr:uncharacterized protein LOC127002101 isoform X3 [Eriocheir sinensis]
MNPNTSALLLPILLLLWASAKTSTPPPRTKQAQHPHTPATAPADNTHSDTSTSPPGNTENTTPPKATSPEVSVRVAVVGGVGVAGVLVVVGVVAAMKWRRYSTGGVMMQPSRDTPTSSKEVVVVENSLYEPFENFQRPQPSHE